MGSSPAIKGASRLPTIGDRMASWMPRPSVPTPLFSARFDFRMDDRRSQHSPVLPNVICRPNSRPKPWPRVAVFRPRPFAIHAMRGISAHSNGFHTCRAIHLLQMLIGAVDTPGSWRYRSPFPHPIAGAPPPGGKSRNPDGSLPTPPLGDPHGPEDLLVDEHGEALRLDRAFSWEAPLGIHGLMHLLIGEAHAADRHPIDTLMIFMSNLAWNSAMNPGDAMRMLADQDGKGNYRIPFVICIDAYFSETIPYADLVLPDTTYLERYDCISLLDRPIGSADGPADAIRVPVLNPDRDVRPFQDVLIDVAGRLGLPHFVDL